MTSEQNATASTAPGWRNDPNFRLFDIKSIDEYTTDPPEAGSLIEWMDAAENDLTRHHVPKEAWCAILFSRMRTVPELDELTLEFTSSNASNQTTDQDDSWIEFRKTVVPVFFPFGTNTYYFNKLFEPTLNMESTTLFSFVLNRSRTLARITDLVEERKRELFLAGFKQEALDKLRAANPELPTLKLDQLITYLRNSGRFKSPREFTNFARRSNSTVSNNQQNQKNDNNTKKDKNKNNKRQRGDGNKQGNTTTTTPEERNASRKEKWIAEGKKPCGWCRQRSVPIEQCQHFYGECNNNPRYRPRLGAILHYDLPAIAKLSTTPTTTTVLDFEEAEAPGDTTTNCQPCPLVVCRLKGQHFTALLDTGSPFNLISENLVRRLRVKAVASRETAPIRSALQHSSSSTVRDYVTLTFAGQTHVFFVLPLAFDAILGQPYLTTNSACLPMTFQTKKDPSAERVTNLFEARRHHLTPSTTTTTTTTTTVTASTPTTSTTTTTTSTTTDDSIDSSTATTDCSGLQMLPLYNQPTIAAVSTTTTPTLPPEVRTLALQFPLVFSSEARPVSERLMREFSFSIELIPNARPQARRPYRVDYNTEQLLRDTLAADLAAGKIAVSKSNFAAPCFFVPKKPNSRRMVIDFRGINAVTVPDSYPLPRTDDVLDRLGRATIFSTLDLQSGYHQIPIVPEDRYKTAFTTPVGLYEWKVLPFGLRNAPAFFQRVMSVILRPFLNRFVEVYIDDVIIYSTSQAEHRDHVTQVLSALNAFLHKSRPSDLSTLSHFREASLRPFGYSTPLRDKHTRFCQAQ